ncbi:MAG: tape measure protein [Magnetococcales bacterium]|nr:tape measure protein [Magnetococcales bacterium]
MTALSSTLEFHITADLGNFSTAMRSMRGQMDSGLRAMTAAAEAQAKRMDQALGGIQAFRTLKMRLLEAQGDFRQAQVRVADLAQAMTGVAQPTRQMVRDFAQAKAAASEMKTRFLAQREELEQLRRSLGQAGVSTQALVAGKARLQQQLATTRSAMEAYIKGQNTLAAAAGNLTSKHTDLQTSIGRSEGIFQRLGAALPLLAMGAMARSTLEGGLALDRIRTVLFSVTGSTAQAAEEFRYVGQVADRLGLGLEVAADSYAKVAAAAKGTSMEGRKSREMFEAVATAATALKLSQDTTRGVFLALNQMLSKGKVQAEELRGQLGERLPGAFQIAARALGVTTAELDKMLLTGSVIADDFLPKFAAELQRTYGFAAVSAAASAQAQFNRLGNAILRAQATITDGGLLQGLGTLSKTMAKALESTTIQDSLAGLGRMLGVAMEKLASFTEAMAGFGKTALETAGYVSTWGKELLVVVGVLRLMRLEMVTTALTAVGASSLRAAIATGTFSQALLFLKDAVLLRLGMVLGTVTTAVKTFTAAAWAFIKTPLGAALAVAGVAYVAWHEHTRIATRDLEEQNRKTQEARERLAQFAAMVEQLREAGGRLGSGNLEKPVLDLQKAVESGSMSFEQGKQKARAYTDGILEALREISSIQSGFGNKTGAYSRIVEVLQAVDERIRQVDESLNKHKSRIREVQQQEEQVWKEVSQSVTAAHEAESATREITFAKRRQALESWRIAALEAVTSTQKSWQSADQVIGLSESHLLKAATTLFLQEQRSKLTAQTLYNTQTLALANQESERKIAIAKRMGEETHRLEAQKLSAQRETLDRLRNDYARHIDALIQEENRHLEASRKVQEDLRSLAETTQERIRRLREKGLTEEQLYASRQTEIARLQSEARLAVQQGEFERGKQLAEKAASLAEESAGEVKRGDRVVLSTQQTLVTAEQQIKESAAITKQALEAQGQAHAQAYTQVHGELAKALKEMDALDQMITRLTTALGQEYRLQIGANTTRLEQDLLAMERLLPQKALLLPVQLDLQQALSEMDRLSARLKEGGSPEGAGQLTARIKTSLDTVRDYARTIEPEAALKLDTTEAAKAVQGLQERLASLEELQLATRHTVDSNVSEVISQVDGLQGRNTTSTHTITMRQVEAHALGGAVGLVRGGRLSGYGGGDRIPALLEAGEFVIRKEAVARYGTGLMQAINAIRLDPGQWLPRFRQGGIVNHVSLPPLPKLPVSVATGAPPIEGVVRLDLTMNGRPSASLTSPRHEVRRLVDALKEVQRGMP